MIMMIFALTILAVFEAFAARIPEAVGLLVMGAALVTAAVLLRRSIRLKDSTEVSEKQVDKG